MKRSGLLLHGLMVPWALLWLAPPWLMAVFATLPDTAIFASPVALLPSGQLVANLRALQADTDFLRAFFSSAAIACIHTAVALLVTRMAGYAFARYRFRGNGPLFALVIATLTVPWFVLAIPQYIMVARDFHLTNTWAAVVVPALASSLGVFFMRQSFLAPHPALLDAARVDGAGEFRIFFQAPLPMVRPALAALGLILFLASWNDYLWPLLVPHLRSHRRVRLEPPRAGTGRARLHVGDGVEPAQFQVLPRPHVHHVHDLRTVHGGEGAVVTRREARDAAHAAFRAGPDQRAPGGRPAHRHRFARCVRLQRRCVRWGDTRIHSPVSGLKRRCGWRESGKSSMQGEYALLRTVPLHVHRPLT